MNDDIFSEIKGQLRPDPQVRARLLEALDAEPATPPHTTPATSRPSRRIAWLAAVAAVVTVGLTVVPTLIPDQDLTDPPVLESPVIEAPVDPNDYAEALAAVHEAFAASPDPSLMVNLSGFVTERAAAFQADAKAAPTLGDGTWTTNAQVAGIDEGDIVKSDGRSIFTASGGDVVIVSADGADTAEVGRIDTTAAETGPTPGTVQGPVIELVLHDSTLVALVTEYQPRLSALPASESMTQVPYDALQTRALLYDVTDPASPHFVTALGQSGAHTTSRLSGDVLYLLTRDDVADRAAVDPADPVTFVPSVTEGGEARPVAAAQLTLPEEPTEPSFQVVSSIDLSTGERIDTASVMGRADVSYMSEDNLFLASTTYESTAMSEFTLDQDSGLTGVTQTTDLVRVDLDDGGIAVAARATIPGAPLNQFALDHFEGHLRVAVTMDGATTAGGWATYPTLFVLDDALNIVGSVPQLAVNEQIQSVRYQGPRAYVVTFRQVDPLFTLDLSTPTAPKVMSALKIPGFSTYLHPWADGRLLGLGMDVSEHGQVHGMKLSMFDTSDPFDVTEATTAKVPFHHAEALSNHKAVFVDPDRGLIGFAVDTPDGTGSVTTEYLLHGYDDETGFTLLGELPVQQTADRPTPARGVTIGTDLYVLAPAGVDVYDADSLTRIATRHYTEG